MKAQVDETILLSTTLSLRWGSIVFILCSYRRHRLEILVLLDRFHSWPHTHRDHDLPLLMNGSLVNRSDRRANDHVLSGVAKPIDRSSLSFENTCLSLSLTYLIMVEPSNSRDWKTSVMAWQCQWFWYHTMEITIQLERQPWSNWKKTWENARSSSDVTSHILVTIKLIFAVVLPNGLKARQV